MSTSAPPRGIIVSVLVGVVLVLAGMLAHLSRSLDNVDVALQLWGESAEPGDVRDTVTMVLGTYGSLTQLITASFGAVALLIAFQQSNRLAIPVRGWILLVAGLGFLAGALMFALLGTETLLMMAERNAVALDAPALRYGRWALYGCFLLAATLIGLYALDLSASHTRAAEPVSSKPAETRDQEGP
jgi:hypothetical protein